ncbi:fatty acid synthase subunit alpha reductase [Thozetella sp. PMI_491]|nr:fatty acid synthase subunit alpha reductase [Thozetella sp. PMI_491]
MHPEVEKELTYTLLIELLAHQFAYPVRWIETQNAIINDIDARRIVEVGPGNTLTNTMKKTWEQSFAASDRARAIHRQFLDPRDSIPDIYYQAEVVATEEIESQGTDRPPCRLREIITDPEPTPLLVASESGQIFPFADSADMKATASAIVSCLVATRLRRGVGDVMRTQTINDLVGGKSTLANEIVGDLIAEFPTGLPERPEELTPEEISRSLQLGHMGRLGKATSLLIEKMVSRKFPGDYGPSRIRQHLQSAWGLGSTAQDATLLLALSKQPSSRMNSVSQVETYLAEVVMASFQKHGIQLPTQPPKGSAGILHTPPMVDSRMLQAIQDKNTILLEDLMGVLQAHIGSSRGARGIDSGTSWDGGKDLLSIWYDEHGEGYAAGMLPKFDARKKRIYDSAWHWNRQEIALFYERCQEPSSGYAHVWLLEQKFAGIVNRACKQSVTQLQYLQSKANEEACSGDFENWLQRLHEACVEAAAQDPMFRDWSVNEAPRTTIDGQGRIQVSRIRRPRLTGIPGSPKDASSAAHGELTFPVSVFRDGTATVSPELSLAFSQDLRASRHYGFSVAGRNALLVGAGQGSIAIGILQQLLSGGARVTVGTSSYSPQTTRMYRDIYTQYGAKGSVLQVVPFNQGSRQDTIGLAQYLGQDDAWDLDYIVPFAAMCENDRELRTLDSRSEIAHRLMFTNVLRLLGAVAQGKKSRGVETRPATVVLPLSPNNNGLFGNDGLYSDSKRSLETLLGKWYSESWHPYLSLLGIIIGWTRGTSLMGDQDAVADAVEATGVRTFGPDEMAAKITTAMSGCLNAESQLHPLVVDLSGGLGSAKDFHFKITAMRRDLLLRAGIEGGIRKEQRLDIACVTGQNSGDTLEPRTVPVRANVRPRLPRLPNYETCVRPLAALEGMADLSRVVVITGFAELGPCGSSRTRWEMELDGPLSLDGCVEAAWMLGLITHRSTPEPDGAMTSSWVDVKTGQPVAEGDIPARYTATILERTGIRKIDPTVCDNGYDPERKETLMEVVLQRDLPAFETSYNTAQELLRRHGDKVVLTVDASGGYRVQLKAGATVMAPRSTKFNRTVAGQIPTGWSARRYGISDDIIQQVDPTTLYALVCTVEALLCSGITDPYELYEHIHVSELGSCLGSALGGLASLRKMHRDRYLERPVQGDILQETFANTTAAWINMLLMSSAGPIKTPVGACATSLESLDAGCDLIIAKKARVCLVGGFEDFVEDASFEFGSMGATCDTDAEHTAGRCPREMSRPMASSRNGFVEAQGCGVQVLTSAELAIEMGLPIFGVVAYSNLSADRASRSVPAPGKGVLTNAREVSDLQRRRKLLARRRKQIASYVQDCLADLEEEILDSSHPAGPGAERVKTHQRQGTAAIHDEARRQEADAKFAFGNQFWRFGGSQQRMSPLRGSLATWGLGIDDIGVAYLHGTSTVQNDLNEPLVLQAQLSHLGRTAGNLLPCVCQKWLTGHGKGAAGAWMINGCLQAMDTGMIPGNANLDNVDNNLQQHEHLVFPNIAMKAQGGGIKACSITSFGFGQKGAQAILVHPRFLFATISTDKYQEYLTKREARGRQACRAFSEAMVYENLVSSRIKTQPPFNLEDEVSTLLDPARRFKSP